MLIAYPKKKIPIVFSPVVNPANLVWLDAADAGSFTLSGSDLLTLTNKGNGGSSGASISGAPQSGTRTQNGLNIFDFAGTSSALRVEAMVHTGNLLFAAAAIVDASGNSGEVLFGTQQSDRMLARANDESGGFNYQILTPTGVSDIAPAGGYEGTFSIFTVSLDLSSGIIEAFVDGSSVGSVNDYSVPITNPATALLMINNNLNTFLDGGVGEYVVCGDPSTLERQKTEGYMAHKWGVESQLPPSHPFKSTGP